MPTEPFRLVVLGRDGVINRQSPGPLRAEDFRALAGSLEGIARLNHAGFSVVIVTNQPEVAQGTIAISDLNATHVKLQQALARVGGHVDSFFFCPHAPNADCDCRLPRPGLLRAVADRFGTSLQGVPVVANSAAHATAALAVGASPIMVRSGDGAACYRESPHLRELPWFDDLASAVCYLLEPLEPT